MFKTFRKAAAGDAAEQKSYARPSVSTVHGVGRSVFSARDTQSLTRLGFAGNPIGFRCIKMIAEAVADVPLKLRGVVDYDQHPALSLLHQANPTQSFAELWEGLVIQLLVSGDAYLEAGLDHEQNLGALFLLRSDRMKVVPGADGWPVAFDYSVGGRKHRFAMDGERVPVLHLRNTNPLDDHYGLSPLSAAAGAIDVHNAASNWSKALLDNAARPSGAIVYRGADGQGSLRDDQYKRLIDELESNHQGARNAGRPMLLEGGLDWQQIGFSPSDMEFQKTKDTAAREIALALGVPPMLLGLPGDNTFANYKEANRAFYRQTVLPLAKRIAGSLGHWLAGYYGEALRLVPDLDHLPALGDERDAQWKRITAADFLSDQEKREMLDLCK